MTIALTRPVSHELTHYDVPNPPGLVCLACNEDGRCGTSDVILVDGELRQVRICHACGTRYTTRYTATICPAGHAWCIDHSVDEEGDHWHRGATHLIKADRNGFRTPRDVAVLDVRAVLVDEQADALGPVIWLSERALLPEGLYLEDGVGFSPARAREVGLLLIQFADDVEGGEPR
jgi:hypothetical protein